MGFAMKTIAERLKHARTAHKDWSQGQLASAAGVAQSTIGNIESGKRFGRESLYKIARALDVSYEWLLDGEGEMRAQAGHASGNIASINVRPVAGVANTDRANQVGNVSEIKKRAIVPLISWVQAGEFSEVLDIFHPGEAVQWEEAYHSNPSTRAYALLVEGDSMDRGSGSPNFPAGTILIVDPDRASHAGDYVIAKDVATQRATFKQLVTDGARWYLRPLNPVYPTIEIDDPALRVIGRVIEFKPPGGKL